MTGRRHTIAVVRAFRSLHAAIHQIAGVARATHLVDCEVPTSPLGARVRGASDLVVAVCCRAARATSGRRVVGFCATVLAVCAQRRMLALVPSAAIFGARVTVVALRVFATLRATDASATQRAPCAFGGGMVTQCGRAGVVGARVTVIATCVVDARFFAATVRRCRAIFRRSAFGVVRRMATATREALVVGALHAVVAIGSRAALTAGAVTALLGAAAFGRARTRAIGPALVDGARVAVIAVFRALAGDLMLEHAAARAAAGFATGRAIATTAAAGRREPRATTGVSSERTQREQDAHA